MPVDASPPDPTTSGDDPLAQLESWGRTVRRRTMAGHRLRTANRVWRRRPRIRRPRYFGAIVIGALVIGGYVALSVAESHRYRTPSIAAGGPATEATGGPFAGTPAEDFAVAEAGLTMPPAQAVAGFTARQVDADLVQVKAALVAGHLDPRMLVDHDSATLVRLFTASQRDSIAHDIARGRYSTLAVQIPTGQRLSTDRPRVSGSTTYRFALWQSIPSLEVITNYVWVYGFDEPADWPGSRLVEVHSEEHWFFPEPGHAVTGMNLGDTSGYWHMMDCAMSKLGLTAPWRGDPPSGSPSPISAGQDADLFQPGHSLDVVSTC